MILKRMGRLKDSLLTFICYDDGVAIVKPLTIRTEGCLESKSENGMSETYYIAKPTEDTDDSKVNRSNYELDKVTLPFINVDGIPMALCYALDGVATNANVLLGLQAASLVTKKNPDSFAADIKVPVPTTVAPVVDVDVVSGDVVSSRKGKGKKVADVVKQTFELVSVRVQVLLPINPLDIHRAFMRYWDQSMLHATKQRMENIGAAKSKKDGEKNFRFLLIIGAVVGIAFAIGGGVLGWLAR
jgi:hypothetical protein